MLGRMITPTDLFYLAADFHRALPERVWTYLKCRGISDEIINRHFLGWNGSRITIPIFNRKGVCASFRLAKDPDDQSDSPKMLPLRDASVDLYGWEVLRLPPTRVIVCEGEFDRLVLESNGFAAVTSTGGAGTFREEWAEALRGIAEVYVCFDNDEPGRKGALRVAHMIAHAKLVALPEEVGDGGDVTDFFARLGKSRDDFENLLKDAGRVGDISGAPIPEEENGARAPAPKTARRERVARLKRDVPIERVIGGYVELSRSGSNLVGRCPFHDDRVPSFTVFVERGTFHCFGCWEHGDVLDFLKKIENMTFAQALSALEEFQSHDTSDAA
jgi:DNA primase